MQLHAHPADHVDLCIQGWAWRSFMQGGAVPVHPKRRPEHTLRCLPSRPACLQCLVTTSIQTEAKKVVGTAGNVVAACAEVDLGEPGWWASCCMLKEAEAVATFL